MNGWDALRMYLVEEGALPVALGSLLDFLAEMFQVTVPIISPPVGLELIETGTQVSSGLLPLQSGVKIPTILPRFEDHHVLYGRDLQESELGHEEQ